MAPPTDSDLGQLLGLCIRYIKTRNNAGVSGETLVLSFVNDQVFDDDERQPFLSLFGAQKPQGDRRQVVLFIQALNSRSPETPQTLDQWCGVDGVPTEMCVKHFQGRKENSPRFFECLQACYNKYHPQEEAANPGRELRIKTGKQQAWNVKSKSSCSCSLLT